MNLIFDIETNGLLFEEWFKDKETKELVLTPPADTIWCIVAMDEDEKIYRFEPGEIDKGIAFLKSADKLIGHNIIGFDIPIIKKLKGIDLHESCETLDTLVLSRLFNPNRGNPHSLKGWGDKLHYPKQEQPNFSRYSPAMLSYCIQDVKLNNKILSILRTESKGFSKESINIEHKVSKIVTQQEINGFLFDERESSKLLSSLVKRKKEIENKVHEKFQPKWVDVKEITPTLKNNGELSKSGLSSYEYADIKLTGNMKPFMRQELKDFNLGSRKQIGEYLIDFGWKPNRFTPTGQPIIDEKTLSKIKHIPEANLIAEFLLLQKRISHITSWIEATKKDNRVHGFVVSNGTITGRMTHYKPNMAQIPSVHSQYGKECRACWIVPEGYNLVGVDASGLEIRMLAHYMADEEYINEVINGDIHTTNQKFAGLESRNQAKTFIYALVYGAGDAKIGSIIKGSRAEGKQLRERFLISLPSFNTLKKRVDVATRKGFITGLDKRKIFIRHFHAGLNTLLQGGGSIVMKQALILLDESLNLNNINYKFVANIHDEWQIEVQESQADFVGRQAVKCIEDAGKHFNLRCQLDGEYKIGSNWSDTH